MFFFGGYLVWRLLVQIYLVVINVGNYHPHLLSKHYLKLKSQIKVTTKHKCFTVFAVE